MCDASDAKYVSCKNEKDICECLSVGKMKFMK